MPDYFYFEPQRGLVKSKPIRSNFYVYRLLRGDLPRVWTEIQRAKVTPHGLDYDAAFLKWLTANDQGAEQPRP